MAYTLRGRLETRLATLVVPLVAAAALAAALGGWWPLQLAALMAAVMLALDGAYDRLLPYQPAWTAVPLGVLELAIVTGAALALRIDASLPAAVAFFAAAWVAAQAATHAVLPRRRHTWAEDGGELGGAGPALATLAVVVLAGALAAHAVTRPPTIRLAAGVHQGPLTLTAAQTLQGEPGTVVRGGIAIRADDVTVRDLTVVGGEDGIVVDGADDARIAGVRVLGAAADGIHVRDAEVAVRDCVIAGMRGFTQGIDISFSMDRDPSSVERCTVDGGREGIVSHSSDVMFAHNHVARTTLRGITVTEMSMGMVEHNDVRDALGVGIYCGDRSMCEIAHNRVAGTRPDRASGDRARMGQGIVALFDATAEIRDNDLAGSRPPAAFAESRIHRMGSRPPA